MHLVIHFLNFRSPWHDDLILDLGQHEHFCNWLYDHCIILSDNSGNRVFVCVSLAELYLRYGKRAHYIP